MLHAYERQRQRLEKYLRGQAISSTIECGIDAALQGRVIEHSRVGSALQGIVSELSPASPAKTPVVEILRNGELHPHCSCGVPNEQWCEHTVALLWRSSDLGFLGQDDSTSSETDGAYTIDRNSPEEVSRALGDVVRLANVKNTEAAYLPVVSAKLDLSGDKLGVQVLFDGEPQVPSLLRAKSGRTLDNVILSLLEEHGTWDEAEHLWHLSASSDIDLLLGLVREYEDVRPFRGSGRENKRVLLSPVNLEARIELQWSAEGAELRLHWVLPDGRIVPNRGTLVGTGPFWTLVGETIYRLSPVASQAAAIFGGSGELFVSRAGLGHLLEALNNVLDSSSLIEVKNPTSQPRAEVATPQTVVVIDRLDLSEQSTLGGPGFEITARLEFDYPTPKERDLVYLPDRGAEQRSREHLVTLGFAFDRNRYRMSGDAALDLLNLGAKAFPTDWRVIGFEAAMRGMRFASLSLQMSVSSGKDAKLEGEKIDWFECNIALVQNNATVPLSSLFRNVRSDEDRWVRLDSGAFARIPGGSLNALKTTLGLLDPNFKQSSAIRTKITSAQALSLSALQDRDINVTVDTRLRTLARRFNEFSEISTVKPTKQFTGKLRSYQEEGLQWLNFLHEFEFGGILADEMGLGKTVQTLAFLQRLNANRKKGEKSFPSLVVCPTSVMMNWMYEAAKFTPDLKCKLLHGPDRKVSFNEIPQCNLVVTSYALLRLDRLELERYQFGYIILDEAQNIKNPDAAVTKAAKALKAKRRLALTGTPTENRPMELWSIMDFLMPGYLGSPEFFRNFIERPILEGGGTSTSAEVTKFLRAKTKPFLLRRIKSEVEKQLPPKIESEIHVEMTSAQARLYSQILEEVRPKVFDAIDQKGVKGASVSILAALLRLRQVCNHPNSIEALKVVPGYDSGKFNAFKELLPDALEAGRKILVFAQFREMLAIMRRWLEESNIPYCYLDGETRNRQDVIEKFNSDTDTRVFLISLKAGGTGLNLASADTVIIYDPWWNPAVENQAVDRAHRIGQTRTVTVYRMVTEDSIEQKIMHLKEKKSKIVESLVNENSISPRSLTKADLENLFAPLPSHLVK